MEQPAFYIDVVNLLMAVSTVTLATCISYLSLPNYRYRNQLIEYAHHTLKEEFGGGDAYSEFKKFISKYSDDNLSDWAATLEILLLMPYGNLPHKYIANKNLKHYINESEHWFRKKDTWGEYYARIYATKEYDNKIAICGLLFSFICIIISISLSILLLFFSLTLDRWIAWLFFIMIILCVFVCLSIGYYACIGRFYICYKGRLEIDNCVGHFMRDYKAEFKNMGTELEQFKNLDNKR